MLVPLAVVSGPRAEVGAGVEEERPRRRHPRHHGEAQAQPLHGLAEVVGAGDEFEPPTPRDPVPAAGLLEPQELLVRRDVRRHPLPYAKRASPAMQRASRAKREAGRAACSAKERAVHVAVEEVEGEGAGGGEDEDRHGGRGAARRGAGGRGEAEPSGWTSVRWT